MNNTSPAARMLHLLSAGALALALAPTAFAQGTAFTYQGRLNSGTNPATGQYDFRFKLYLDSAGTTQAGTAYLTNGLAVNSGLFTTTIDFGPGLFTGSNYWLEVGMKTNGVPSYTVLAPLQALTPTPYASFANSASNVLGTVPAAQLSGSVASANWSGTYANAVTLNNAANQFTGSGAGLTALNASQLTSGTVPDARLSANVSRLGTSIESSEITDGTIAPVDLNLAAFNLTFWRAGGNAGTAAGSQFVGTTDNQALEFRVDNQRGLRLEPTANSDVNVIGGSAYNSVAAGVAGATIGGGSGNTIRTNASYATISGGGYNTIQTNAYNATIGGGSENTIQTSASLAAVGGGLRNTIQTGATEATIGGGGQNAIQTNAYYATISGGADNSIQTAASSATIGGGSDNTIQPRASSATIGGGYLNLIQADAYGSFIGGGSENHVEFNANVASIGGGDRNTIQTGAYNASIGGGSDNTIRTNGYYATIPGGWENSAAAYAFAAGSRAKAIHTGTFVWADSTGTDLTSPTANSVTFRASGGVRFFSNSDATLGVSLAPGGNSWSAISDRNAKKNFQPVDGRAVLEKLAQVPVERWNYKPEADDSVPHIGPMAQDFKAAFYPGRDDTSISTLEFDGVELAAIQGLNQKVDQDARQKDAEIAELKRELRELKQLIHNLAAQKGVGTR